MHLPIAQVPNIARALEDLKSAGFWVGGATEHAEDVCWDAPFEGRVALVMGSEGDGISRLVLDTCDFTTKLPQRGATESLNVAQAATALCFEVALVMGSEGDGISRLVLDTCDFTTKLPQRGATESLNVAQAATALCFEWMRRNRAALG